MSIEQDQLVEPWIDRILTQYREAPKLQHVMRVYLRQIEEVVRAIHDIPQKFHIDTAVGDQLTLVGKRMGWGRCHCVCVSRPVHGFACEGYPQDYTLTGFCEPNSEWLDCDPKSAGEICIDDDELYRKFLQVRSYQMTERFSLFDLEKSCKIFWGDSAMVLDASNGRVVLAPGRDLTDQETAVIQLFPRVLPVAPGIKVYFHLDQVPVAGFGIGWEGFCETLIDDAFLVATDDFMVTAGGDFLTSGEILRGGYWMCPIDPHPYDCV